VTLRPATVCGYAPRQRLDVIVNILTNHAHSRGVVRIIGGSQMRPNVHVQDMVDAYLCVLDAPDEKVAGEVFNVGHANHSVARLAEIVRDVVGRDAVRTETEPTNDLRSYHISSEKIAAQLGFRARRTIEEAAEGLVAALRDGRLPDSMTDARYFNIKRMQELDLQ
jgi:nucleoside-diphosphate-sugar epimerase